MSSPVRTTTLAVVAALWPVAAWAQYPSELVGFNGPPIDPIPEDIPACMEMFQTPQVSGSTDQYILLNEPNQPYGNNAAFRASGLQTEGEAAMRVYFNWVDPADPQGWLRLTTWDGPERPNPALHTQGKVRFKLINRSEFFQGEIGICIGIRETGQVVPQMTDGGASGDIEWVGVTGVGPDPNNPVPIPAVTLPVTPNPDIPYELEWDLSTGVVYLDGASQGGGIAAFTGDGILNAPNNRGTLEHIAFTNVTGDTAVFIDVAIDELQFEAPEPDPVVPPTVVWPIIAGDMQVTVTDLQTGVDQVNLLLDGAPYLSEDVTTSDDVIFALPAAAETGQAYSATQRANGVLSEESAPVIVLPEPPTYTFSLLMDENGDGGCDTYFEWVGVTDVEGWAPVGQPLFTSDGVWQTIDVPLDDDSLVLPSIGGNGMLDPSPSGFYTIDSIWFTLGQEAGLGPWEVLVDAVQYLDESGQVGETILNMEDGVNRLQYPRGQSPDGLDSSGHTQVSSYDGRTAHRLVWEYNGEPPESVGILQRIGYTCGTSALIPDTATAVRFHMVLREQPTAPDIDLPEVVGPIVVGTQDTVRILNDETATSVQLYLNGEPAGNPMTPTGTFTDFGDLTLTPGDSVSATQTLPAGQSDLAYPRAVAAVPPPPMVGTPLLPGAESVTVVNVLAVPFATATEVNVYINGFAAGSAPGGSETVEVPTPELQPGDAVTATQTVNGVTSDASAEAIVADTTLVSEYEFAPTLADLSRAISASDLINGRIGELEGGDVDPANGVEAWNMAESDCLEMLYTEPSPGFHGATPGGSEGGLADLTDGVEGSGVEAVLADYYRAALVVRYDFQLPMSIREIVVFAANEDPGAPNNGRIYQHYDVWASTDNMQSFEPLALGVVTGQFGYVNSNDFRATFTRIYDGLSPVMVEDVTNLRFVFYDVSNTGGRLVDPWQGNANEGEEYQSICPDTEPEDTDGFRKAFEAPIIKEIDVFGLLAGDVDGDGDVDLNDLASLLSAYGSSTGDPDYNPNADFDNDGDVDLTDLATLLSNYGLGT